MPAGETEKSPSAWTIDSLHQHMTDAIAAVKEWAAGQFHASERRIDAAIATINDKLAEMDRRYEDRWKAQQTAITEKDKTTDERLAKMNEFRGQLEDQSKTFMPRIASDQRYDAVTQSLQKIEDRLNIEVRRIDNRLDTTAGVVSGADKYRATLIAIAACAVGITALVVNLSR